MRRILLLNLLLFAGALMVQASSWAQLAEVSEVHQEREKIVKGWNKSSSQTAPTPKKLQTKHQLEGGYLAVPYNRGDYVSLLPEVLRGKTITVFIEANIEVNEENEEKDLANFKSYDDFKTALFVIVRDAFNDWFKNAVDVIKKRERVAEFSDVLPILERGATLSLVDDPEEAMLIIDVKKTIQEMQKECRCDDCRGCEYSGDEIDRALVIVLYDEIYYDVVVHELGHAFGMADAYDEGYRENASKIYGSKKHTARTIMQGDDSEELTPDDADGLINMIDLWTIYTFQTLYQQDYMEYVSPRVKKGWNSLDLGRSGRPVDYYRMGTSSALLQRQGPSKQRKKGTAPKAKQK